MSGIKSFLKTALTSVLIVSSGVSVALTRERSELLLAELSNASGASGFEQPVRQVLVPKWQKSLSHVEIDRMGNLKGDLAGPPGSPKILFMAHLDEIGMIVRDIDAQGFVRVDAIGGILNQALVTQRWKIETTEGPVVGYSGLEAKHSVQDQYTKQQPTIEDLYLDVGAKDRDDAMTRLHLRPGLPIVPDTKFVRLNRGDLYLGKAFDDRAGLAALTEAAAELRGKQLLSSFSFAATVQEEVGLRGAGTLAKTANPDVVINVEAGIAKDFPHLLSKWPEERPKLGKGPTVFVYDRSMLPNNKLVELVLKTAKRHQIPVQFELGYHYGEDAARLQQAAGGVPTINLGIPVRYAHTQSGVIDASDYQNLVKLLVALGEDLNKHAVADLVETV